MNRNTLLGVLLACAFAAGPAMAADADAAHAQPPLPDAVVEAMRSEAGVPMLAVDLQCNAGRAVVTVQQNSHLPLGLTAESASSWSLPSCVHYA